MSTTLSGTTLGLVEDLPATYDAAGYEALTFVNGTCALKTVPLIGRTWTTVEDAVVCREGLFDKKGNYKYEPVTFQLNIETGDPAQDIYKDLENDHDVGSFKLALQGGDVVYFTAQVSQFNITDGGDGNTINMGTVTLLPQTDPVYVEAA